MINYSIIDDKVTSELYNSNKIHKIMGLIEKFAVKEEYIKKNKLLSILDIIVIDDTGQIKEYNKDLSQNQNNNIAYEEGIFALFIINPENKKKGTIFLYYDDILSLSKEIGYSIDVLLFFFLAHEVKHFLQFDLLGKYVFEHWIYIEKDTLMSNKKTTEENHKNFYTYSRLENDANFFAADLLTLFGDEIKEVYNYPFSIECTNYVNNYFYKELYYNPNGRKSFNVIKISKLYLHPALMIDRVFEKIDKLLPSINIFKKKSKK